MNIVTSDLAAFGQRELAIASKLLKAYGKSRPDFLGKNTMLKFNPDSGHVFLADDDYGMAVLDGQDLKQWAICCVCGREGFADERDESNWKVFLDPRICEDCAESGL